MDTRSSYLSERSYISKETHIKNDCTINEKEKYWKKMLGEETFFHLKENNPQFIPYIQEASYEVKKLGADSRMQAYITELADAGKELSLIKYGVQRLKDCLQEKEKYIDESIYKEYELHLSAQIQNIYLRTFIAELHAYKDRGFLKGQDEKEEYDYFCRHITSRASYMKELFSRYPVLGRCIEEKIEQLTVYYSEVVRDFEKDRGEIAHILCGDKKAGKIVKITGNFSDTHNGGRQVLKLQLDNGCQILYKPHSMENEMRYEKLLRWLVRKTGIQQYEYGFLSYDRHSWSQIVKYKECTFQKQLREYYLRLGVQLFLVYFLGTKDLHNENIIACGEYPVLIDLENLVNITYNRNRKSAAEEISYQISQSVLYTGLLPFYTWNKEGKGVNGSGISGTGGQKYPFKMPVILDGGTSKMRIGYRCPTSKETQNLATLNGEFHNPAIYKDELIRGFAVACRAVIGEKEGFRSLLEELEPIKSRYLLADTQRYAMLLSTSYHPSLLKDGGDRGVFFYELWRGRKKADEEIVKGEIEALLNGDIPYFYYILREKDLYTANGRKISGYFSKAASEILYERLDSLGVSDIQRQCGYIRLALELMPDDAGECLNRTYVSGKVKEEINRAQIEDNIHRLTEHLLKYAVWNSDRTEVSWFTVQMRSYGTQTWNIMPMNLYLYDGLAGMRLLLYSLARYDDRAEIKEMEQTLEKMLFDYTDRAGESVEHLKTRYTGLYEGEGSLVYTYLLLYKKSGGKKYLEYAEKHAAVLVGLLGEDKKYDILSGNAGAAMAFLYLYEEVPDKQYLKAAEKAIAVLASAAKMESTGIGWITEKGFPPLGGMAHGNAGILMPVMALWKKTKKEKYGMLAEQIWMYEEALYNPKINNWNDVRVQEEDRDGIGAVAWCHGAAGVLLSRINCFQNAVTPEWKERMWKDIRRAYEKTKGFWKRDSLCLCHGTYGNLWILEKASEFMGVENVACGNEELRFLPQEKLNPGFMNGYGGVLYFLLEFFTGR